jgi:hypothetical protein
MDSPKILGLSNPANAMALVEMAPLLNFDADLKAVRTGIGTELKKLFSEVLREPLTDRMAQLLSQFDQPNERRSED